MKSYTVWLDRGITVNIDVDADTNEGHDRLQKIAIKKFIELLKNDSYAEITWDEINTAEQGEQNEIIA